jgi:uncharacterized membrane protein YsdA (DUF1294 family)
VSQSLLTVIILVNCISICLYGFDKYRAVRGEGRLSEFSLLVQAALGPFGALLAMIFFRHKIRKLKFFVVPLFLLVQIALLYFFQIL